MYLAPVSGPLALSERERGRSRAGLERPFGQPGRASEHARTAAPFTGATAQKKRRRRVGDERGASLAAGARAGAEVFEKPSGDGDDDGDGDDAGRACLSVRVYRPLVDPPARSPAHGPLRAFARRVWDRSRAL